MNNNRSKIINCVGKDYYNNALYYPKEYITLKNTSQKDDTLIFKFEVESDSTYDYYDVSIETENANIKSTSCKCNHFKYGGSCKHIAACLFHFQDDIFVKNLYEKNLKTTKMILEEFYKAPKKNSIKLKKELTLDVEITFMNSKYHHNTLAMLKFKIGEDKLYSLNSKMSNFLIVYENALNGEYDTFEFGKKFTFDPSKHFFNETDSNILEFLIKLINHNPYNDFQNLIIKIEELEIFINILQNKTFTITDCGSVDKVFFSNPFKIKLTEKNDYYNLKIDMKNCKVLDFFFNYIKIDSTLYKIPPEISRVLTLMNENNINELSFTKNDLHLFTKGLLKYIKKDIELADDLKDSIILGSKPNIKIYLDLKGFIILATIKLEYENIEIDYFNDDENILRDEESEEEVISTLLKYGFQIEKKKIYMDDLEEIGTFLEENLLNLAKKYEVFTSNKIKNTNILKDTHVTSTFSIGKDNIMSYSFDLGKIKNEEITDILDSLKSKKKYYKLKSGDIVNLEEDNSLQELEQLISNMDLSKNDLKNGSGTIPKYRAIYIDSLKKDKYSIIKTNNLFDELIKNFNSYKDFDISLTKKDTTILRDYQLTGVKWLYNIYKCGFGCILADEMGLGKSIQLIYFIKCILKENKDAKILIVAPTSLVYNWKNEFEKFGNDIKYKVFAENRLQRKNDLQDITDINVLITTYGLIRQDREDYLRYNFELIAIDEAQNIKNPNAQMTKCIKELKGNTKVALTGTPLENSVMELWSIFDFIMPGYLANIVSFRNKYNIKDVDQNSLNILETLNKQISPFILRRKKKDVIKELPDKIENNIFIDLDSEQKKIYIAELEKTKKELDDILKSEGFAKGNFKILSLITRLRELCIDPRLVYENYKGKSAKIENLTSIVQDIIANGHKILLFTSFKMALNIVNKDFNNNGISTYIIDGSVSSKKRMELVDKFNKDDTNVFLITLKSGGTGLNLTSADVVIHLDLWWNPQVENQATDRAHRIGQKNTVEVIRLITNGTIEERILELQNKKCILSDQLIEGEMRDENIISKLTEKDIKNLLSLDNEEDN